MVIYLWALTILVIGMRININKVHNLLGKDKGPPLSKSAPSSALNGTRDINIDILVHESDEEQMQVQVATLPSSTESHDRHDEPEPEHSNQVFDDPAYWNPESRDLINHILSNPPKKKRGHRQNVDRFLIIRVPRF